VVQSDWKYNSVNGTAAFSTVGADEDLRSVFSLYSEPLTAIVLEDSGIKKLSDLKGKRVNIGDEGSGMRGTFELLMEEKGWRKTDFEEATSLKPREQIKALCDGEIDVMLYMAGHPNATIQEVTTNCKAKIIPIEGKEVDSLIKKYPFYTKTNIPGGKYPGNQKAVPSFGVKATFVTSKNTSEEIIYQMVKSVFDNFDTFKTMHPVFATLKKESMVLEGNTAGLHRGSKRYFEETGLLSKAENLRDNGGVEVAPAGDNSGNKPAEKSDDASDEKGKD